MSAAAPPIPAPRGTSTARRRLTLAERLRGAWTQLAVDGATACPCCGGEMHSRAGEGRCGGCGARLA